MFPCLFFVLFCFVSVSSSVHGTPHVSFWYWIEFWFDFVSLVLGDGFSVL